jgi:hypothetical protein
MYEYRECKRERNGEGKGGEMEDDEIQGRWGKGNGKQTE